MDVLLNIPYLANRICGGTFSVAFDTIEGFKKINEILYKKDINIYITLIDQKNHLQDKSFSNIHYLEYRSVHFPSLFNDMYYVKKYLLSKQKYDLIHSHSIYGATSGCYLRIPTVFTLHGIFWKEITFSNGVIEKLVYNSNIVRLNYIIKKIEGLIPISDYVQKELTTHFGGIKFPIMKTIENPVSDRFFSIKKEVSDNLILYPGIITPRKNQLGFLKTLKMVKSENDEFKAVLCGSIDNIDYYKKCLSYIQNNNLNNNVTITGEVSESELIHLYRTCTFVALFSNQETAPVIIAESMACETPVIATNDFGIKYMIKDGENGFLINPEETKNISEKIIMLFDDLKQTKEMGLCAKKEALNRWSSDKIAIELVNFYENMPKRVEHL